MSVEESRIAIALGTPTLDIVSVSIKNYTGDSVFVAYQGLPGNQPKNYRNFVAIWESSQIAWSQPPMEPPEFIGNNSQSGSVVITGLTISKNAYTIGYGVGPDISNICASARLNAGGLLAAPMSVTIGINYVGSNSISVSYQTLAGYRPATYKNWVGLWKGYASPYNAPKPEGSAAISSDSTEGSVGINNVPIAINTTYTVAYFAGPSLTEAAAILTFNTADYNGLKAAKR